MELAEKPERRAVVIGGSIAGLFVGAFLRRIGWQVDIYERSSTELIGRGVGIFASHLELLEALDKCGADTVDIGVIVYKRVTLDRRGEVIADKPLLQIVTSWDRLRQVLLRAIDRQHYHFGYAFVHVEQEGSSVRVQFANGGSERADLLIACDGFRSASAAKLRLRYNRSTPVIISGVARQMKPISLRKLSGLYFLIFPFFWLINFRSSVTRFQVSRMNCEPGIGATISHGIGWPASPN